MIDELGFSQMHDNIQMIHEISRRHTDLVKKLTAQWLPVVAYDLWELSWRPVDRAFDIWLQAEEYIQEQRFQLIASAPWPLGQGEVLTKVIDAFSSNEYFDLIRGLTFLMWDWAGRPVQPTAFMSAAEKHGFALMAGAIRTAASAVEAEYALAKVFTSFQPEKHLGDIQKAAYAISENLDRRHPDALGDWLEAESKVLDSIASGTVYAGPLEGPVGGGGHRPPPKKYS